MKTERVGLSYHLPRHVFVQALLRQSLRAMGQVVRLEKTPDSHIWVGSIRLADEDLGSLLFRARVSTRWPRPRRNLTLVQARELFIARLISKRVRGMLAELGPKVARDEIAVTRNGPYLRVSLIWPKGEVGALARPDRQTPVPSKLDLSSTKN